MSKWGSALVALAAVAALEAGPAGGAALGQEGAYRTRMRLQMGSLTEITVPAASYTHRSVSRAFEAVDRLERLISTYLPESEVSRLAAAGRLAVSTEVMELTRIALRLARTTGGAFNPALGPVIRLWRDAEERQRLPSPDELERARRLADYDRVVLDEAAGTIAFAEPGMGLNFGAIGKGYALDKAAAVLRAEGIANAVLASGGSSHRTLGKPLSGSCWELAIRHPGDPDRQVAILRMGEGGLATSAQAGRERVIAGRLYGRIIDPRSGRPAAPREPVWSATVLAAEATSADALATALIVMEAPEGLRLIESMAGTEALLVRKGEDGSPFLEHTRGLVQDGELDGLPLFLPAGQDLCHPGRIRAAAPRHRPALTAAASRSANPRP